MGTSRRKIILMAITVVVAAFLCTGGLGIVYASNSGSCGENATWTLDDNGKMTIAGSGAIAENAFAGRTDIRKIVIGEQITSIGSGAFSGCTDLWLVVVPAGVTSIGTDAFKDTEVIIAGTEGSYASTYASQNNISFKKKMNFSDVAEGDWYYESVAYVYYTGLMGSGTGSSFGVEELSDRAQIAVILHRFSDGSDIGYMPLFPDVSEQDWYAQGVIWANQVGILQGTANGYCEPTRNITRQEFVQILYNYVNYKGYNTTKRAQLDGYSDIAQLADYAEEAMQWAVRNGVISGKEGGTKLAPLDQISQAEVAAMIRNFTLGYGA